ncbi:MAG: hypothetical protein JXB07_11885 [Anaerolineae bacterium]|nr:hypothetical protein [Anaerolineae bacterium]
MRLWSLHPGYLDAKGLTAVWREGLLARKVLIGQTKGYRHHPQLERFRRAPDPVTAVDAYLMGVYQEANLRGYHFDLGKIAPSLSSLQLVVTDGQLCYELRHLKAKLKTRDPIRYARLTDVNLPQPHPLFEIISGDIEPWEKFQVGGA